VSGCNIHGGLSGAFQRLNPACFTQPALGVYGNTGRNFLRQPGINNWDMGLGKYFSIGERVKFAYTWTRSTPSTITNTLATWVL